MRIAINSDLDNIIKLLNIAFYPSKYESNLIELLIKNQKKIQNWVIEKNGKIIGYIAYTFAYKNNRSIGYHLAPVAIHPEYQNNGIGSQLIEETLNCPILINKTIFVLGDPLYYQRFGFKLISSPICPFDSNNSHFLAMNLNSEMMFTIGYELEFYVDTPATGRGGFLLH